MSEQSPQPVETSFHFVFCEHLPKNAQEVAESLSDCDLIAFESTGESYEDRWLYGVLYSAYVAQDTTTEQRYEIESFWDVASDEHWILSVLQNLPKSDKKIVLIDAAEGDDAHRRITRSKEVEKEYRTKLLEGASQDELEQALHEKLLSSAVSIVHRERLVVKQLDQLAENNPGKRIGVVMGALHTGVQHHMNDLYQTDRQFIVPKGMSNNGPAKINFAPEHDALRQQRFNGFRSLSKLLLRKVLLSDLAFMESGIPVPNSTLQKLSAEDIEQFVGVLSQSRQQRLQKPQHDAGDKDL